MRRGSLHPESRAPRRHSMSMAALQSSPGADHGTTTQAGPSHTAPHTLFLPSAHWSHWALEHRVHSGDTDPSLIFKCHHMGKGARTASERASVTPATRADACGS